MEKIALEHRVKVENVLLDVIVLAFLADRGLATFQVVTAPDQYFSVNGIDNIQIDWILDFERPNCLTEYTPGLTWYASGRDNVFVAYTGRLLLNRIKKSLTEELHSLFTRIQQESLPLFSTLLTR